MNNELLQAIAEEIGEVETMRELTALWCYGQSANCGYGDASCVPHFKAAVARLRSQPPVQGVAEVEAKVAKGESVKRAAYGRKYRLLKKEVEWSTKPQVHAIMAIICAHAEVGDVLDEADVVRMMVENEAVLQTRQGGKRIWDYYKGDHAEGLLAHGNVEKI